MVVLAISAHCLYRRRESNAAYLASDVIDAKDWAN